MSLPVVVADDSTMSRKLTIRALPAAWEVDITEARNGREALEAYRRGLAGVMFLDLTMPEMSGFEVLEALQGERRDCFVIVISADVQPKARARVMALGAMAFLRKPVDADELARVLREYGLLR